MLRAGSDPNVHKTTVKLEIAATSFRLIATEWWEKEKGRWSAEHAERVLQTLKADVFPIIGDLPISQIKAKDCLFVIRKIEERGALDVASRVKQRMSAVYRYAIYTGYVDNNPVTALVDVIKTKKVQHRAALPLDQLPAFLNDLNTCRKIKPITRYGLRLIVLTFVRPGEVRAAKWVEFDIDKREWRIPAERMKMKEEHIVPLTDQSIEILEELHGISGN